MAENTLFPIDLAKIVLEYLVIPPKRHDKKIPFLGTTAILASLQNSSEKDSNTHRLSDYFEYRDLYEKNNIAIDLSSKVNYSINDNNDYNNNDYNINDNNDYNINDNNYCEISDDDMCTTDDDDNYTTADYTTADYTTADDDTTADNTTANYTTADYTTTNEYTNDDEESDNKNNTTSNSNGLINIGSMYYSGDNQNQMQSSKINWNLLCDTTGLVAQSCIMDEKRDPRYKDLLEKKYHEEIELVTHSIALFNTCEEDSDEHDYNELRKYDKQLNSIEDYRYFRSTKYIYRINPFMYIMSYDNNVIFRIIINLSW